MAFYFKNTKKDIIMTEKDEEDFRSENKCRFFEKSIESDKVRNRCHLTGYYRVPAHSNVCNVKVTQDQIVFIPFLNHNFSNYDCHLFFKKIGDEKKDKVKFKIIPKTNEEYISVKSECIRFIDNYRFLSSSLDSLGKTLIDNSHEALRSLEEENVDNVEILNIIRKI